MIIIIKNNTYNNTRDEKKNEYNSSFQFCEHIVIPMVALDFTQIQNIQQYS